MRYPHILAAIRSAKWAVTPVTLQAISDVLSARLRGEIRADDDSPFMDNDSDEMGGGNYDMLAPGVARVRMSGIIGKGLSSMETACGGCDIEEVEENLTAALSDAAVATVVLDINSPGGTVGGVPELSERIEELSAESGKPVWAYISGQGCSAAYWIACGCSGIAAAPSADVGSIGVYMALIDVSENWEKEGYKLVLIKAGDYKAAGIAGSKITPQQIALWQKDCDAVYAQFTSAVIAARGQIPSDVMQGQSFYGQRAADAGLVDQIMTLGELCESVAPRSPTAML